MRDRERQAEEDRERASGAGRARRRRAAPDAAAAARRSASIAVGSAFGIAVGDEQHDTRASARCSRAVGARVAQAPRHPAAARGSRTSRGTRRARQRALRRRRSARYRAAPLASRTPAPPPPSAAERSSAGIARTIRNSVFQRGCGAGRRQLDVDRVLALLADEARDTGSRRARGTRSDARVADVARTGSRCSAVGRPPGDERREPVDDRDEERRRSSRGGPR